MILVSRSLWWHNTGVSVTLINGEWDCSCMRNEGVENGGKHSLQGVCEKHRKYWKYLENSEVLCICEYFQHVFTEFRGVCVWSQHSIYWRPACRLLPFRRRGEPLKWNTLGGKGLWMDFNKMKDFPNSILFFLIV